MIRDANQSDLPQLAAASLRLQKAHVEAFPDLFRPFETSDALSNLSELMSRSDAKIRVAIHKDTMVGHVVLLIETKSETLFTFEQRVGRIAQLEVEPDFRRQGYGRLLIADCERIAVAHGLGRIEIGVWGFNGSAKSFYEAVGYDELSKKMSSRSNCESSFQDSL